MAVLERDADLGFALEAADSAAMTCARIDDDPWPRVGPGQLDAFRRLDAHQRIVDGAIERAAVDDNVVIEGQHRLETFLFARNRGVAAPAQRFQEQDPALRRIAHIVGDDGIGARDQKPRQQGLQ
jgi:hypothetical protein